MQYVKYSLIIRKLCEKMFRNSIQINQIVQLCRYNDFLKACNYFNVKLTSPHSGKDLKVLITQVIQNSNSLIWFRQHSPFNYTHLN